MTEPIDLKARRLQAMTEDYWPIEKKIAFRAAILFREENPELTDVLGKAFGGLVSVLVRAFTQAAIELRDELECIVVTDLAGMNPEDAAQQMQKRLERCVSPITHRLQELEQDDG